MLAVFSRTQIQESEFGRLRIFADHAAVSNHGSSTNLAAKAPARVRICMPGCSTCEEVYPIAICMLEHLGDRAIRLHLSRSLLPVSERRARSVHGRKMQAVSPERRNICSRSWHFREL